MPRMMIAVLLVLSVFATACGDSGGGDAQSLAGWERGGSYDKLYKPTELDSFKGYYQESFEFSGQGLSQGMGIVVEDRADGELVRVHLGPTAYVGKELEKFGLRRGQKVKVRGAWARFEGEDVFIASKVKKGEYEQLKVRRTKDGMPYWAMSPEELTKELAEAFDE